VILVALAVIAATTVGVVCERRFAGAPRAAAQTLRLMLYGLVPFVSYVNIAHLNVTVGAGVGIALGWVMILLLGFFAVGVNLSAERRAEGAALLGRPDRRVAVGVGLRLLAAPLVLATLAAPLIRLPSAYLLQAGMPSGVNTLIVGHAYDLDLRLISGIVVWSTLVVLATGLGMSLLV